MSDERLRELERRFKETGDPADEAAYLKGRLRRSEVPRERVELAAELSAAIDTLSADHRAVLVLADVEGFSYEEVAQATGCSVGTVKSRLSRARGRVRDHFAERRELLPASLRLEK